MPRSISTVGDVANVPCVESLQRVSRLCLKVKAIWRNELYVPCAGFPDRERLVRISNQACDALRIGVLLPASQRGPASSTVGNSDAVAYGRMRSRAIASPILESSTLPELYAITQLRGWHVLTHALRIGVLLPASQRGPASSTVGNSDAVAYGRMCSRAIASPIPESSTLPELHAVTQLRGWHEWHCTPEMKAQVL